MREVYRGERRVTMRRAPEAHDPTTRSGRPRKRRGGDAVGGLRAPICRCSNALRAWRRAEAARQAVPPYVIFHDRTLAEIARATPRSDAELAGSDGVGQGKLARYGAAVLEIVAGP